MENGNYTKIITHQSVKNKFWLPTTAVCSNWGFWLNLKLVLCLERWFLIYSFGLSSPQLQQATGVGSNQLGKYNMKEEFVIFQKFTNQNSAIIFGKLMDENNIKNVIENISVSFDPILSNNEFGTEYSVNIKKVDFEKADAIYGKTVDAEINEIQSDYYLLSFSNKQLIEVLEKSDEWHKFDVILAKKILKERGKEITDEQLEEIKKQRILELSKPEKSQGIYIVTGYFCAIMGGLLGIFIGWHLLTYKKTLPNGSRIYAYSENDRKHGNRILILGGIFIVFWILYKFFK